VALRDVDSRPPLGSGRKEPEPLSQSVTHLVEEARMLIPGVTAFLGFQLIAVFNQGFSKLDSGEQEAHLLATFLMLLSLIILLTPAAYHRQIEPGWVSDGFVRLSSRLIMAATPLFALGVTIDFYLLVRVVTEQQGIAALSAGAALAITALLWYGLPRIKPLARLLRGSD